MWRTVRWSSTPAAATSIRTVRVGALHRARLLQGHAQAPGLAGQLPFGKPRRRAERIHHQGGYDHPRHDAARRLRQSRGTDRRCGLPLDLPDRELEREKEVIADEINTYKDSPADLIYDTFEDMLFAGSELGHNILGRKMRSHATTGRRYAPSRAARTPPTRWYSHRSGTSRPKAPKPSRHVISRERCHRTRLQQGASAAVRAFEKTVVKSTRTRRTASSATAPTASARSGGAAGARGEHPRRAERQLAAQRRSARRTGCRTTSKPAHAVQRHRHRDDLLQLRKTAIRHSAST